MLHLCYIFWSSAALAKSAEPPVETPPQAPTPPEPPVARPAEPAAETPQPAPAPPEPPPPADEDPHDASSATAPRLRSLPQRFAASAETPRWTIRPTLSLAATTRNLVLGGKLNYGGVIGAQFSLTLGGDYLLSGLISGFLLDDIASPRFVSSQVISWVFPFPGQGVPGLSPVEIRRRPRISVGAGLWETLEFDSLLQSARTEDFGVYQGYNLGGQLGLIFPYVSLSFGLKPFGAAQYTLAGAVYPTEFQFQNALLDVDVSLDLAELWMAGKRR